MGSIRFLRSTVGRKVVMGVTGLILVGFVVGHVSGNLLVFKGPGALNAYSAFLKKSVIVLYGVRVVLLAAVGLHIWAAYSLTRLDQASRPVAYSRFQPQVSTLAARTMRWGGVLLLAFIVYHLLHFTVGSVHPSFSHTDVYGNVITGLRVTWVAVFYIVAMVALGAHLYHGVWSFFQTMGWNHPRYNRARRQVATALAVLVALGFIAIPAAVLGGVLR
jgi:succinate dehydrogenase / fumarate reductase cytochrome b subunit